MSDTYKSNLVTTTNRAEAKTEIWKQYARNAQWIAVTKDVVRIKSLLAVRDKAPARSQAQREGGEHDDDPK
ncbi:hypothetical protein PG993_011482 [Apiospora rasikravindrae]|uniref:Uncharacterized protein n=1 Tax=Apiospora rasikravindrae TaxID=990691 RepID=A0ABR1SEC6_9PEZI